MLFVEAEVHSSSVGVVYVVRLRIVFSKAALQKKGSMESMDPPLDLPLTIEEHFNENTQDSNEVDFLSPYNLFCQDLPPRLITSPQWFQVCQ